MIRCLLFRKHNERSFNDAIPVTGIQGNVTYATDKTQQNTGSLNCEQPATSQPKIVLSNSGSHCHTHKTQLTSNIPTHLPTSQMSKHSSKLSSPHLLSTRRRPPDVSLMPEEVCLHWTLSWHARAVLSRQRREGRDMSRESTEQQHTVL